MVGVLANIIYLNLDVFGYFMLEAEAPTEVAKILSPVVVNVQIRAK